MFLYITRLRFFCIAVLGLLVDVYDSGCLLFCLGGVYSCFGVFSDWYLCLIDLRLRRFGNLSYLACLFPLIVLLF